MHLALAPARAQLRCCRSGRAVLRASPLRALSASARARLQGTSGPEAYSECSTCRVQAGAALVVIGIILFAVFALIGVLVRSEKLKACPECSTETTDNMRHAT